MIILIGDGMGFGQVAGARAVLAGVNGRLAIERLPVTGWLSTHSAEKIYTDSGAGADLDRCSARPVSPVAS